MNPPWEEMRAAADLLELLRTEMDTAEPAPVLTAGSSAGETWRAIFGTHMAALLAPILRAEAERVETVAALVGDQVDWGQTATPEAALARLILEVSSVTA